MKRFYKPMILAIAAFSFAFFGCEKTELVAPVDHTDIKEPVPFLGKKNKNRWVDEDNQSNSQYPLSASSVVKFHAPHNQYRGASVDLEPTQSVLSFDGGALTPPAEIPYGDPVTITFQVDYNPVTNELTFTFGPHGCQFSPAAEDWSELDTDTPVLYYIDENDNYIEQQPEQINYQGRWMIITVDHFSRYAVAHG